jgi:hypothetical protein
MNRPGPGSHRSGLVTGFYTARYIVCMFVTGFPNEARYSLISVCTTRCSPYCNITLRQHHKFGCIRGVLWHRNSDLVVICVFIATKILSCNIYFLCCNRLTLMHPLWGFVLHLVGNTTPPFLRCISMLWVAIESCYGHGTRLGCAWTAISQGLIWVANISLRCCNRLALMHLLFRIVLHLVGNTATLFLRCTRNSCVAIETCYGYHTRVGCAWTAISQLLI